MSTVTDWIALITPLITLVMLVSLRIGVTLVALPAPFGDLAPMRVRAGLAFGISLILCLPLTEVATTLSDHPMALLVAAAGEVAVGSVIGVTVRVMLAAISIAGSAIGFSTGLAFAQSVDPAFGESMTPVSRALGSLGILIFLSLQGHHAVLGALAESMTLAPPGDAFGGISLDGASRVGESMVAHGLRIASPVMATMFIVQLGMALTARTAPKVQIFQLSFAVAVSTGLVLLWVAAPSFAPSIAAEVHGLDASLASLFEGRP